MPGPSPQDIKAIPKERHLRERQIHATEPRGPRRASRAASPLKIQTSLPLHVYRALGHSPTPHQHRPHRLVQQQPHPEQRRAGTLARLPPLRCQETPPPPVQLRLPVAAARETQAPGAAGRRQIRDLSEGGLLSPAGRGQAGARRSPAAREVGT